MNTFMYENQGSETMLVYHLSSDEHLDNFAKGMLQGNEMEGILRPSFTMRDTDQYLKYPVTSKLPLREFLSGELERETVLRLFLSVADTVKELEEYMLSPEKLVLNADYIFVDVRKKKVGLIYFPIDEFTQQITMKEFLREMLSRTRFQLDQDVSYVAKLLHFLNQPDPWEYEELKRYIESLMQEKEKPAQPRSTDNAGKGVAPVAVQTSYSMPLQTAVPLQAPTPPQTAVRSQVSISAVPPQAPVPPQIPTQQPMVPQPPIPGVIPASQPEKKEKKGLFGRKGKKEEKKEKQTLKQEKKKGSLFGSKKKKEPKPFITPESPIRSQGPLPPIPGMPIPPQPTIPTPPQVTVPQQKSISPGIPAASQTSAPPLPSMPQQPSIPPQVPVAPQMAAVPQENGTIYMGHGSSADDSRTVIMGGGENYESATILIGGASTQDRRNGSQMAKITRKKTGQSMVLNQNSLRIGSEGSFVDFYIADNPAIGGCHADIMKKGGCWYLTDRNSANHTYLNGRMLPPMQAVQLDDGAIISLADEDFVFTIR